MRTFLRRFFPRKTSRKVAAQIPTSVAPPAAISWQESIDIALLLSDNDSRVRSYLTLAQHASSTALAGDFYQHARANFPHNFIGWLDEDTLPSEKICASFKTVLAGLGYMAYLDWKDIYSEEVLYHADDVLESKKLAKLSIDEKHSIQQEVDALGEDNEAIKQVIIEALEHALKARAHTLLCFDEDGDSYAFFIVTPDIKQQLVGKRLDRYHHFPASAL